MAKIDAFITPVAIGSNVTLFMFHACRFVATMLPQIRKAILKTEIILEEAYEASNWVSNDENKYKISPYSRRI